MLTLTLLRITTKMCFEGCRCYIVATFPTSLLFIGYCAYIGLICHNYLEELKEIHVDDEEQRFNKLLDFLSFLVSSIAVAIDQLLVMAAMRFWY